MVSADTRRDPGYLERAERSIGRRIGRKAELAAMLAATEDPALARDFERALFLARFWEGAAGILRRTGPDSGDTARLSAELAAAVEEVSAIIGRLLAAGRGTPGAGADPRPPDPGGMARLSNLSDLSHLSDLLADLAILKAYELRMGAE